ncbi:MAG: FAD-dependent oxidoreductase [Thermodesulfobacteriota bacterium]
MDKLFEKARIGNMELKNRIIMPAMGLNYTDNESVTQRMIDFFIERAKGGVGLIISAGGYIEPRGRSMPTLLSIAEDKFIPGLKKLTSSVHKHGAKIGIQIYHGGKYAPSSLIGEQPISASAVLSNLTGEIPRELSISEIKEIVTCFAQAVKRAQEAGFDAVEFNCCSGYLIREFLSPVSNKRIDQYGGEIENRLRFLLEIIEQTRKEAGRDYPLICRISADEFLDGGNTLKEGKVIARELEKAGIDAISVTGGGHETDVPLTTGSVPHGAFLYLARGIKEEVEIPVIGSGRINDPIFAEKILSDGIADFVAIGRPLLADPEFPNKAREGRYEEIRKCVACHQGCFDNVFSLKPVTCMLNPSVGREKEFEIRPAGRKKKVMVIGGGPGGMEAARVLGLRGHDVSLYESREALGGQLNFAAVPPGKEEFENITRYFSRQLEKLNVKLFLEKDVTQSMVKNLKPGAVVISTGASPKLPDIPGIKRDNVFTAKEVLAGRARIGKRIVIAGGGAIGCETALFLATKGTVTPDAAVFLSSYGALDPETAVSLTRRGKDITIVEMFKKIGRDIGKTSLWVMRKRLKNHGINIVTEAKVEEITENGVKIKKGDYQELLEADTIVLAVGSESDNKLFNELQGEVKELYAIGDCKEPRKALDAIYEGAVIGRQI